MSLESVQYRSIIRFLYLNGKSRDDIQVEFNDVYGEQSPSLPTIKRWFNEFNAGRTSVVDPVKSIKKITSKLEEIIQNER